MGIEAERIINAIDREINKSRSEIVDLDEIIEFKEFKNRLPTYKSRGFGIQKDWPKDFVLQMLRNASNKNICGEGLSRRIYVLATRCR